MHRRRNTAHGSELLGRSKHAEPSNLKLLDFWGGIRRLGAHGEVLLPKDHYSVVYHTYQTRLNRGAWPHSLASILSDGEAGVKDGNCKRPLREEIGRGTGR